MEGSVTFYIEYFLQVIPHLSEEEINAIVEVLSWPDEKRTGFKTAKSIFEKEN